MANTDEVSPEFQARLHSKLAKRVIPPLLINFFFCLLLRFNISNAHDDMFKTLGWPERVYGNGVGTFYITYILFQIPANACLKFVKPSRWLGFLMVFFALLSGSLSFIKTPEMLYIIRLLMGAFEAGFYPGIAYCITLWFSPEVRPSKFALVSISGACSVASSGALAYFILQINGLAGLHGWQWLFVLEAGPALLWGVANFCGALPDPPCYFKSEKEAQKALAWLSPEEFRYIQAINNPPPSKSSPELGLSIQDELTPLLPLPSSSPSSSSLFSALLQLGRDVATVSTQWKIWAMGILLFLFSTAGYAFSAFLPTIYSQYGLSEVTSNLLTSPVSITTGILYALFAMLAEKYQAPRFMTVVTTLVTLVGIAACVFSVEVQPYYQSDMLVLVCASLAQSVASVSSPLMISWTSLLNKGGPAAISIAFANSISNLGGIVGPQLMARSGSTYGLALSVIAIMSLVGCIGTFAMFLLDKNNNSTSQTLDAKMEKEHESDVQRVTIAASTLFVHE